MSLLKDKVSGKEKMTEDRILSNTLKQQKKRFTNLWKKTRKVPKKESEGVSR